MNVGPYQISGELGRGAAGVVFSGRAPDGREVAIKLLHRATPEGRARFERERRLLTGFGEAEGFVPLLDAGDSPQGPWLAMPLVSGGTLRTRLSRGGALPVDEAVALVRALGEALGRAHAQGVVHRDLKPENVLFTAEGRALITDLGLAKHFRRDLPGGAGSVSMSKTGELRGTAGYMAPEQVDSAKSVGPPADVFALGSLLHECLTGRSPFPGETLVEVVRATLDGNAEPPSRLRPEVPRWLDAVVARCLAPAADARFADGAALATALEAGDVAPAAPRRGGLVAVGVGLLVLVVAAAGALAARPRTDAPSSVAPVPSAAAVVERLPARDDLGVASTQDWARAVAVLGTSTWTHAGAVEAIALTPDGERVVSGGEDQVLRVWSVADGRLERELDGLTASPMALAISPDGRLVAAGAADGTVAVWDLVRGVLLQSSRERDGPVTVLTFSPDGALVMSGGGDGRFGVGRFDEPSRAQIDCSEKPLTALAFTKDGARFATGDAEGVVLVFEVPAWERARRVGGVAMGGGAVRVIAFVEDPRDPRNLEVVSVDATAMVRSVKGAALAMSALGGDAWKVALSSDAARVVVAGQTDVRVFQRAGDRLLRALFPPGTVRRPVVALSADGSRVAVGAQGQCSVAVFDLTTGAPLPAARGHAASVRGVARTGDAVVSLDALGGVVRWEAGAPRRVAALEGTLALAVAADGRMAVTTHAGAAVVWDAGASSSRALSIPPAAGALAFTPRGDQLLVATREGPVQVVELATGASVRALEGHTTPVRALSVDPAGERAVSGAGAGDDTARVWRLSDGQEVHRLEHPSFVSAVAVSRDLVLTCCQDDVVRAWDVDTGARVRELTLDQGPSNTTFEPPALAFTPDGAHALAGGSDGALHVWRVSDWALVDEVRFEQPAGNDRAGFRPFERATSVDVAPDGRTCWLGTSLGRLVRLDLRGGP